MNKRDEEDPLPNANVQQQGNLENPPLRDEEADNYEEPVLDRRYLKRRAISSGQIDLMRYRGGELLEVISEEADGQDYDQSSVHNSNNDDNDNLSDYSTQSYDPDDLLEGPVAETNRFEIEKANRHGVSRTLFPSRRAH